MCLGELCKPLAVGFGVAIVDELPVMLVRGDHAPGVLDGAPVPLSSFDNLPHVGDQAIGIRAARAVQFLQGIQIG